MLCIRRGSGLTAILAAVISVACGCVATAQTSPSAYVYVQSQGSAGPVYGYSASSAGKLATISGSPFKPGTQIVGGTASKFFTIGKTLVHSYALGSNGGLEAQESQVTFLNYAGNKCGGGTSGIDGAELDHSGKYVYVLLANGGDGSCTAYQTFMINSDGSFTFGGDTEKSLAAGASDEVGLPSILGNDSFGYATEWEGHYSNLVGFKRENTGSLQLIDFSEKDPTLSGSNYLAAYADGAPSGNFVVVQLYPNNGGGDSNPPQLASYTVDSSGNLTTTNTSSNMPTTALVGPASTFSSDGKLIAFYSNQAGGNGIEIYRFNGANPLTLYKKLLTGTPIDTVKWDSSNHLYAISRAQNKLYVFTVTATSVSEDTSVSVSSPWSLVVISKSQTSTAATQYETPLINYPNVVGKITVDTSGNLTTTATGLAAGKSYTVQFCPAVAAASHSVPPCFNVTKISANGSGDASATAMFPKTGNWAGDFSLNDSGGTAVASTGLYPGSSNSTAQTFLAKLVPDSTTNGGAVATEKVQNPLVSGTLNYSNNTLVIAMVGADPNATYNGVETYDRFLYSSQSYALPQFTTNAAGNANASVNLAQWGTEGGDMFTVESADYSGAGFIGGFSIP